MSDTKKKRRKKRHSKAVYKRRRAVLYTCITVILLIPMVLLGNKLLGKETIIHPDTSPQTTTQTTTTTAATADTTAATVAEITTTTTTVTTEPPFVLPNSHQLEVKAILQNPELPTGCEVTSLTTLLQYLGYDVSKTELANNHLPCTSNGGVSFNDYFVGSPYIDNSFGCFAPVIVKTAESYFSASGVTDRTVMNLTGTEFSDLFPYIAKGNPIVIWATMNLKEPIQRVYWNLPDGTPEYWYTYEHCMVLTGYDLDRNLVYASDPLNGNVSYALDLFQLRYEQLGSQCVIIY